MTLLVDTLSVPLTVSLSWIGLSFGHGGPLCPSEPLNCSLWFHSCCNLWPSQYALVFPNCKLPPLVICLSFLQPCHRFSQSQSDHTVRLPPPSLSPLPPSLPVVLRPLSLTLSDSRLKRRNRVRERLTMMPYNKPCLLPNCSSFLFFTSPQTPPPKPSPCYPFIHVQFVCKQPAFQVQSDFWDCRDEQENQSFRMTSSLQFLIFINRIMLRICEQTFFLILEKPICSRCGLGNFLVDTVKVHPWNWSLIGALFGIIYVHWALNANLSLIQTTRSQMDIYSSI